jgi:hypothetical protein
MAPHSPHSGSRFSYKTRPNPTTHLAPFQRSIHLPYTVPTAPTIRIAIKEKDGALGGTMGVGEHRPAAKPGAARQRGHKYREDASAHVDFPTSADAACDTASFAGHAPSTVLDWTCSCTTDVATTTAHQARLCRSPITTTTHAYPTSTCSRRAPLPLSE